MLVLPAGANDALSPHPGGGCYVLPGVPVPFGLGCD
jgi:hypothetical protein